MVLKSKFCILLFSHALAFVLGDFSPIAYLVNLIDGVVHLLFRTFRWKAKLKESVDLTERSRSQMPLRQYLPRRSERYQVWRPLRLSKVRVCSS